MARFSIPSLLFAIVLFSPHAWAQFRSNAASVTLVAGMEESFTIRYGEIRVAQTLAEGAGMLPATVQVFLYWRLRGARSFKIAPALEAGTSAQTQPSGRELMTLSELAASSQVFGFVPSPPGPARVLGIWGDSEEKAVGAAAILLVLPARDDAGAPAYRFSVAIF